VYELVGGRAGWTALGLPTEGSVGDRKRISHYLAEARTVDLDGTVGDIPAGDGPVAVLDRDGVLLGGLAATAGSLPAGTPVKRAMAPAPGTIRPELRIDEAVERLHKDGLESSFVTTVRGVLLGIVYTDRLHV
jgi:hypothetical protein